MFYKNLLLFCFLLISACGFTPMNRLSGNENISKRTQQIDIASIPNQEGWLLRQKLQNQLNPQQMGGQKKYTLIVQLKTPRFTDQSIEGDAFASRETARLSASYILKDIQTNQILIKENTSATGAYNIVKEPYATQIARNKLKENLINMLADNIVLRISVYFKTNEALSES